MWFHFVISKEPKVANQSPNWVPADVDITKPSAARAYDAFLGGGHNFEVDRRFAEQAEQVFPGVSNACRANRDFLRRAVLWGMRAGVRQFLDLGSGPRSAACTSWCTRPIQRRPWSTSTTSPWRSRTAS